MTCVHAVSLLISKESETSISLTDTFMTQTRLWHLVNFQVYVSDHLWQLGSDFVRVDYASQFTSVGAGSMHAVWTLVSATCSLHLTVSPLIDVYTMRSGFHRAFILTLSQESSHS